MVTPTHSSNMLGDSSSVGDTVVSIAAFQICSETYVRVTRSWEDRTMGDMQLRPKGAPCPVGEAGLDTDQAVG